MITLLKCKIHRATVTDADLTYEGSISIDPVLCEAAGLLPYEKVDVLNVNNGARLSTYVIHGGDGEICLNGAAARHAQKGDKVILVAYQQMDAEAGKTHQPRLVFVDDRNSIIDQDSYPKAM